MSESLRVVNNDGSLPKDQICMIKGRGLACGLTEEEAQRIRDQLDAKLKKLKPKGKIAEECQLDVEAGERARALHRVVRAMHDGHCPSCGHLQPAEFFQNCQGSGLECPKCKFRISALEADKALEAFRPYLQKSVEIFKEWRKTL